MPDTKKSNKTNGLEDPTRFAGGPLAKSADFVDSFVAGFIYAAAIEELVEQTLEMNAMMATMDDEEREMLLPTLEKDGEEIDAKWMLASMVFGYEA